MGPEWLARYEPPHRDAGGAQGAVRRVGVLHHKLARIVAGGTLDEVGEQVKWVVLLSTWGVNRMISGWKIYLFGKFRLEDPSSKPVPLKSRRLENLLAVLAVEAPRGVLCSELARILWPNSESSQSLRQSIYELRAALGSEMIDATATWCRLSEHFHFESDYQDHDLRTSTLFMPEAEGEWFEWQRAEVEPMPAARNTSVSFPASSLSWLARSDAKSFFKLLETAPNLVRGFEFSELKELVKVAQGTAPEARGWSLYWKGVSEENLTLCESYLERAFEQAQICQNSVLASEVALELGKVYSRLAKMRPAYRSSQILGDIAEHSGRAQDKAHHLRLRGTVNCYFGKFDEGISDLTASEQYVEDALGRALAQVTRSYYLVSVGRRQEALALLDRMSAETRGLQHTRISINSLVIHAIAMYHAREGDGGMSALRAILEQSWQTGFTQHGVCAADLLAQIHGRRGEVELSNEYLAHAEKGRSISKAVKTPLELHRELYH